MLYSCKKEPTVPNTDNYNPAQSNALIKSLRIIGDANERTEFEYMINSSDGNCYYHSPNATNVTTFEIVVGGTPGSTKTTSETSKINNEVGKIRYDGTKIWSKYAGIGVRGMTSTPTATGLLKDALVVGGFNKANGSISIFSSIGQPICNKEFSKTNYSIWFNNIKTIETNATYTDFLAGGGMRDTINNLYYPYLIKIRLDNNNYSLSTVSENIFTDLVGQWFSSIELITENGVQNIITTANNTESSKIGVCKINSNYMITWKKEISEVNTTCSTRYLNKIISENGRLYLCGDTDDNEKGIVSNGRKWRSCLLVCLDMMGNIMWQKKISSSKYSDYARQVLKYGNNLFLIGGNSWYWQYDDANKLLYNRSNGAISKVDATSGNVINTYTFGEKTTSSGFGNVVLLDNDKLLLGGFVNYNALTEVYQSWLVGLNLSDL